MPFFFLPYCVVELHFVYELVCLYGIIHLVAFGALTEHIYQAVQLACDNGFIQEHGLHNLYGVIRG